ncbi:MAG: RNA 2',3'-cyclic phosphodiesterase [Candidatus Micrarchaeales archaeon]|jgi:2'-5' RNA ligase
MRAFIAIEVPDEIKNRVETLQKELQSSGIILVKKEAMHLTLQFLGEINAEEVELVKSAIEKASRAPFRINLSGISYFSPDFIKVIFVAVREGTAELNELYTKLADALTEREIRFEREEYMPHLTIARVKHVGDRKNLIDEINKHSSLEFGSFEAKSIFLKKSTLTPNGPIYENLYELKL